MLLETYNKQTASLFRDGIDYVSFRDKFESGPDYEAEEDRVECVAGVGEEGHD